MAKMKDYLMGLEYRALSIKKSLGYQAAAGYLSRRDVPLHLALGILGQPTNRYELWDMK